MKIFGYTEINETEEPLSLKEVSFCCTPEQLKKLAKFFNKASKELEKHKGEFNHTHLYFFDSSFKGMPDIVVHNPDILDKK